MKATTALLLGAMLGCALPALAGFHGNVGLRADAVMRLSPDLYGETMIGEKWAATVEGHPVGPGANDVAYTSLNRPGFQIVPAITERLFFDFGFGVEIAQRFVFVEFAPNRDLSITFRRFALPITVTPRYEFAFGEKKQFRPFVGLGGGVHYTTTEIAGFDLYDQTVREDGSIQRDSRDFSRADWFWSVHGQAGFEWFATDALSIAATVQYEYVSMESIEIDLREDGPSAFHWEEDEVAGDGGGVSVQFGVTYGF
jgi:hypothetical protein